MGDTRTRKWMLTINNPLDKGYTHDELKKRLSKCKGVLYWCMSDEEGLETHTHHTHIYIQFANVVRFSTMQNRFPKTDLRACSGTGQECKDYVFKEGKYLTDKKADTNDRESHEEYGQLPVERQGARNDLADLYDMIKSGMSDYEILEENPNFIFNVNQIEKARQTVRNKQFSCKWVNRYVEYIWGITGSGKTSYVCNKYGYENVYRVTDYQHPFDSYTGQDVIIFEEFHSSLFITDMLKYLDGHPCELPARYNNKIACYTKVYFCTNIDLREQYPNIQSEERETWKAFLRRIHAVHVLGGDIDSTLPTTDYLKGFFPFFGDPPF